MEVPEVDVDELAVRRGEGAPLVDVRMPDEYEAFHVPGAVLIPLPEVPTRLAEVPADGPVYVICATGARSRKAAEFYRSHGIEAVNVAGGSKAWAESGRAVVAGCDPE